MSEKISLKKTLCIMLSVLLILTAGLFCMSMVSAEPDDADVSEPSVSSGEEASSDFSGEESSSEEPLSGEPSSEEPSSEEPSSEEPSSEEPSSEEPSSEEPSSEEPQTEPPTQPDDGAVAEIYHCATGMSLSYFFGHTWICIRNVGTETLYIGSVEIEPGRMISAGLHYGPGLDYNREMRQFAGKGVTALKARIGSDGFNAAAAEMQKSEWSRYMVFTHNCTNFSTSVWSAATGQRMSPFIFPFVVKSQMSSRSPVTLYVDSE